MSGSSFDLNFRPKRLFWPLSAEQHLLATVKGAVRHEALQMAIDNEALGLLSHECFQSSLDDQQRQAWGASQDNLGAGH